MGCGLTKEDNMRLSKGVQSKVMEMSSSHDMAIHKKLEQLMDLNSNLNINSKYDYFVSIL